jgi:hypothetical protein
MDALQSLSVLVEVVVCVLGLCIAAWNKRDYGWYIALTFGIYVLYDLTNFMGLGLSDTLMRIIFFIASLSMLVAVWKIYRRA